MKNLNKVIDNSVKDKEVSELNEKLLSSELAIIKKIKDDEFKRGTFDEDKTEEIVKALLSKNYLLF